jgi:hypothetical protein
LKSQNVLGVNCDIGEKCAFQSLGRVFFIFFDSRKFPICGGGEVAGKPNACAHFFLQVHFNEEV